MDLDLIDSDIPLLMSKSNMKYMRMKIDLEEDVASIWGTPVDLKTTSTGHYLLPLTNDAGEVNIARELRMEFKAIT